MEFLLMLHMLLFFLKQVVLQEVYGKLLMVVLLGTDKQQRHIMVQMVLHFVT